MANYIKIHFLLILLLCFAGCKENNNTLTVSVEKVQNTETETYGEYDGDIRAYRNIEIHARVEGFLENITFNEGKKVRKGEPLFYINSDLYKAKVEKAKAQLEKDKAQKVKAEQYLERIKPVYEQNAASEVELENAQAALNVAKAAVTMSQADLDQAQLQLSYTVIYSPITGYISERYVDIGSLVGGARTLLATVIDRDTVEVHFSMTPLEYLKCERLNIHLGETDSTRSWQPLVTVTLADNSVFKEKGIVDFAAPQVNPETGKFEVRAKLANPNQDLLPGQKTKVKLLMNVRDDVAFIPQEAISSDQSGKFVYIVRSDNTVEKRYIETGEEEKDNRVSIIKGLSSNDVLITENIKELSIKQEEKVNPKYKGNK